MLRGDYMAIQNRRGSDSEFDASKMMAGEFGFTTDGTKKVYAAFGPGDVKEVSFKGDDNSANSVLYTEQTLTNEQKQQARKNINAEIMPSGCLFLSDLITTDDSVSGVIVFDTAKIAALATGINHYVLADYENCDLGSKVSNKVYFKDATLGLVALYYDEEQTKQVHLATRGTRYFRVHISKSTNITASILHDYGCFKVLISRQALTYTVTAISISSYYLSPDTDNNTPFEVSGDYNLVHKKYVDEQVANLLSELTDIKTTLESLTG